MYLISELLLFIVESEYL